MKKILEYVHKNKHCDIAPDVLIKRLKVIKVPRHRYKETIDMLNDIFNIQFMEGKPYYHGGCLLLPCRIRIRTSA